MRFLHQVFVMLFTEDFSMRHYVGFLQIGSHIHSIFGNTVHIKSFIHYFSKLNFLCTCASTTINYPQNLGIQLYKRCNKDLPKLQSRYMTNRENKNKTLQSTITLFHHSSSPVHCLYIPQLSLLQPGRWQWGIILIGV